MEFSLPGFEFSLGSITSSPFSFSPFEWGCLILCLPHHLFWNHITSLVSRVFSGRVILPQDEMYLESYLYLDLEDIQKRLWTLDFRVDDTLS